MKTALLTLSILIIGLTGCNKADSTSTSTPSPAPPAQETASASPFQSLLVPTVDGEAVGPAAARQQAESGSDIVLTGYIGGRAQPFVEGRAMFTLVDTKLPACTDGCSTPWDACCEVPDDIIASSATVQVLDPDGKLVKASLNGPGLLTPGQVITLAGTVQTNDSTSFVINANKVAVSKE